MRTYLQRKITREFLKADFPENLFPSKKIVNKDKKLLQEKRYLVKRTTRRIIRLNTILRKRETKNALFLFSTEQIQSFLLRTNTYTRSSSNYLIKIKERKKFSLIYGHVSKKFFQKAYLQAKKERGSHHENIIMQFEKRLDIILYRIGFTKTIAEARQIINHNWILVNGVIHNISSYQVQYGDIISIDKKRKELLSKRILKNLHQRKLSADYLDKKSHAWLTSQKRDANGAAVSSITGQSLNTASSKAGKGDDKKKWKKLIDISDDSNKRNLRILSLLFSLKALNTNVKSFILSLKKNYFKKKPYTKLFNKDLNTNNIGNTRKIDPFLGIKREAKELLYSTKKKVFSKKKRIQDDRRMNKKRKKYLVKTGKYNKRYILAGEFLLRLRRFLKLVETNKAKWAAFEKRNNYLLEKKRKHKILLLELKKGLFPMSCYFNYKNTLFLVTGKQKKKLIKPIHLEVSFKSMTAIVLYRPQKLVFPGLINIDILGRSVAPF